MDAPPRVLLRGRANVSLIQNLFNGTILHSTKFKRAVDHIGKKVVVVGAGTSGMCWLFCENLTYLTFL
jgi:hypothetical protein